ncbi:hypothetical protein ILUMI_14013 [Ignelater luminosus]|uniref:Mos1 transposase HTH domain-containing protein n=1 Tax=Ignelater luminosus TaxID=2038154 RepID=A0A8K0CR99_IGNLU|nr:hypothetical protein ILUMI_14013 [Ignelater luminosus]
MDKFEIRAVIKYLCKKELSPKEIHNDMTEVLGESSPSYQIIKNGQNAPGAELPKTVITQENVNVVHDMVRLKKFLHDELNLRNLVIINRDLDQFLKNIVSVDETWVHHFDPESKRQSMEWQHKGSQPPRKFRV